MSHSMPEKAPSAVYAKLDTPFDQPAFDNSYFDHGPSQYDAYPLRPMPTGGASVPPGPGYGQNTQTPYDSAQHLTGNAGHTGYTKYNGYDGHGDVPPDDHLHGQPWRPGFREQFPWLGILALTTTAVATFAAVIVLVSSNGKRIDLWSSTLQPTVYLSVATALANIFLTYALYQGIVISFWRKAIEGGTLYEMHQHWNSGSSFWGAIRGVFQWKARAVSVACIMTVLSILRGPLMQRASDVQNTVRESNGTFTVHAAQQLPFGWAGRDTGRTSSPSLMNPNFTVVAQQYAQNKPMRIVHSPCGETCHTSIEAFGFGVACNKTGHPYDLNPIMFPNGSYDRLRDSLNVFESSAGAIEIYGHGASAELDSYGRPTHYTGREAADYPNTALLLNTTLIAQPDNSGKGSMVEHTCALRGGVVSYHITISNDTVVFQSPSWRNDTFLYDRGMEPYPYNSISNLAGFTLAANNMYSSSAAFQFVGGAGYVLNIQGALANNYLQKAYLPYGGQNQNLFYISNNISFRDPMEDMINGMRELAFRSALSVAQHNLTFPNSTRPYSFTGSQSEIVYVSNYRYMAAAVAVSLAGVIAVIPTYRGWWMLGRKVTLSPLEVAKAFDAPMFAGVQSNLGAKRMLSDVGGRYVRYGDVSGRVHGVGGYDGAGPRRLQFLNADMVGKPAKGVNYL